MESVNFEAFLERQENFVRKMEFNLERRLQVLNPKSDTRNPKKTQNRPQVPLPKP
jgi:hypothetical protein